MNNISGVYSVVMAVLVFLCINLLISSAYAHPPKGMELGYDEQAKTLTVTISHPTYFPSKHHISAVEIKKNGTVIKTETYDEQPDQDEFAFTYEIDASADDVLEVTADCNIFGSKTASMTVGASEQ